MTPEELIKNFSGLNQALQEGLDEVEIEALFFLLGRMKRRVFNDGEDLDGKSLGGYSKAYAAIRKKRGLQDKVKKLQFEGDLAKNTQVGTSEENNVIGYLTDDDRLKVEGNERYLNTTIIGVTDEDQLGVDQRMVAGIDKIVLQYI
jgi:hypothetical protein